MCSLENRILCQGKNSILRPENMLIHPNSITHEDTIMPKKIRKIFRKSPRPSGGGGHFHVKPNRCVEVRLEF